MPQPLETGLIALSLSAIARLQQVFLVTPEGQGKNFLLCAADILDRTVPAKELAPVLRVARIDPVPVLVANRLSIAAVPPGLWNPPRVNATELAEPHSAALAALESALRRELKKTPSAAEVLVAWLAPVWLVYPELEDESLTFLEDLAR